MAPALDANVRGALDFYETFGYFVLECSGRAGFLLVLLNIFLLRWRVASCRYIFVCVAYALESDTTSFRCNFDVFA